MSRFKMRRESYRVMDTRPKRKKDSFDRLSEAKERQSYPRLNEPGTTLLPFAFALLENNPFARSGQPTRAWSVKCQPCSRTEPRASDSNALEIAP
jgi:hypothetical protein